MARRTVRPVGQESPVALIIFIVTTVGALIGCYFLYNAWQAEEMSRNALDRNIREGVYKKLLDAGETGMDSSFNIPESGGLRTRYGDEFFAKYVDRLTTKGVNYGKLCEIVGWNENAALADGEGSIRSFIDEGSYDTLRDMLKDLQKQVADTKQELARVKTDLGDTQSKLAKEKGNAQQAQAGFKKQIGELQKTVGVKDEQIKKVEADAKTKVDGAHKEAVAANETLAKGKEELKAEVAKLETKLNDALGKVQNILDTRGIRSGVEIPPDASLEQRFEAINSLLVRALTPTKTTEKMRDHDGKILETVPEIGRAYVSVGKIDGAKKGTIYTVYGIGKGGMRIPKAKCEVIKVDNTFSTVGILEHNPRDPILPGDIVISPETLQAQQTAATPAVPAAPSTPPEEPAAAADSTDDEEKEEKKEE